MEKVTVVIAAKNEEKLIKECIKSAHFLTKNVIVFDMQSSDKTQERALEAGATVSHLPPAKYVELVRKVMIESVKTDWVIVIDPDERIAEELAEEIKAILDGHDGVDPTITYFQMPRQNMFAGQKWLSHGGWWPDYQTRLLKKSAFIDWPEDIHSEVKMKGTKGVLTNPLIHLMHGDFEQMVEKTVVFEDVESDMLRKASKRASTTIFFRKFFGELYRRMIKGVGFLDGKIGIIESIYQAFSKTITYLMLYEKKKESSSV